MQRTQSIWIVNHNDVAYEDRFDGEDFFFPPGEPVEIPVSGADLMFGYGLTDKTSTLMRAGQAQTANDLKQGMVWLANFSFHNTKPTERELAPALESPPDGGLVASPSGVADQEGVAPAPAPVGAPGPTPDRVIRPVPSGHVTSKRIPA